MCSPHATLVIAHRRLSSSRRALMPVARRLPKLSDRTSGVLLHPTSLPGGRRRRRTGRARRAAFVDFLAAAGQSWWQMLPVGPTGYGNSPYSAQSAFAGNPALVERRPADRRRPAVDGADRGAAAARSALRARVRGVPARRRRPSRDFTRSRPSAPAWLDDFALYRAHQARARRDAVDAAGRRRCAIASRARSPARATTLADEIAFVALRAVALRARLARAARPRARARHRPDRRHADLRRPRQRRRLAAPRAVPPRRATGEPTVVAGVPPDYFSATGQRWGNPLYRWDRMRADGLRLVDRALPRHARPLRRRPPRSLPRLRALLGDPGARADRGQRALAARARARDFFEARAARAAGDAAAHRRGLGRDHAGGEGAARRASGCPGIKILQFAFGTDPNAPDFLPHNYPRNAVVYTGTHDNDTTVGWFHDPGERQRAAPSRPSASGGPRSRYLGATPRRAAARDPLGDDPR